MQEIFDELGLSYDFKITGHGDLQSRYCVTELAVHTIAAVGASVASLLKTFSLKNETPVVEVNRRLSSLWFERSIHPINWKMPPTWDAISGDYQTKDGWIKLHTNLPRHRAAACKTLGVKPDRDSVMKAVSAWNKEGLEAAIIDAGGVAAAMRNRGEWQQHPQGIAIAKSPLIEYRNIRQIPPKSWPATKERPLAGLKILDLTRVLAGPVATRTLAGFGAQVLRIDPPDWEEPNVVPDVTLGKNCARLDLTISSNRVTFERLIRTADILVHGYRPGALDNLGFDKGWRNSIAPNLIEITLDAYGWTGPWAHRRGFDSLVQMCCGIADAGMTWSNSNKPTPLPVQALDHATGYLMAAATIKCLENRGKGTAIYDMRLSLARTAELLVKYEQNNTTEIIGGAEIADFSDIIEHTPWGKAHRLKSPIQINQVSMMWDSPSVELGSSAPKWI